MSDGRSTGVRCPQIDPSADPKFRVHGTPTDPTYLICSCILSRRQESESADQQSHEIGSNAPASFANWSDTASDGNLEGELMPWATGPGQDDFIALADPRNMDLDIVPSFSVPSSRETVLDLTNLFSIACRQQNRQYVGWLMSSPRTRAAHPGALS